MLLRRVLVFRMVFRRLGSGVTREHPALPILTFPEA